MTEENPPATPPASSDPSAATPTPADAAATPEAAAADSGAAEAAANTNASSMDALFAQAMTTAGGGAPDGGPPIDQMAIDDLLKQASFEDPSSPVDGGGGPGGDESAPMPDAAEFKLPDFQQVMTDAAASSIDMLRDVDLNVKIELGRSRMLVEDVLKLGEGSVVELDKLAGDPVDVFVNDRLIARGEVLVLNDNFCVRINEIVASVKEEGL